MSLSGKEIAQAILEAIGGERNVKALHRCATRLRFTLKNASQVREESLKRLNGIIGIIEADNRYYIIPESGLNLKIYNELAAVLNLPEITVEKKSMFARLRDALRRETSSR